MKEASVSRPVEVATAIAGAILAGVAVGALVIVVVAVLVPVAIVYVVYQDFIREKSLQEVF